MDRVAIHEELIAKRGTQWEEKNSGWTLLAGIGLIYIGLKMAKAKWFLYGFVYTLVPIILMFIFYNQITNDVLVRNKIIGVCIIDYFIALIHCFYLALDYLILLDSKEERKAEESEGYTEEPSIQESSRKDMLDINSCNEDELAELPGIGLILAKKAIKMRSEKGSFASVDDFIEKLNIAPHYAEKLSEILCCDTIQENDKPEAFKVKGRMVDY